MSTDTQPFSCSSAGPRPNRVRTSAITRDQRNIIPAPYDSRIDPAFPGPSGNHRITGLKSVVKNVETRSKNAGQACTTLRIPMPCRPLQIVVKRNLEQPRVVIGARLLS
jgi:hypothetical protein